MKPFVFSLERMQNYKQQVLNREKNALRRLRQQRDAIEDRISELQLFCRQKSLELQDKQRLGMSAAELNAYGCLMENARRQLEQCRAALVQAEAEVERQRKIVLTATQELSGLDKLEEKQLEAYRLETARDTEQQISEQVSMRLVRKRSS